MSKGLRWFRCPVCEKTIYWKLPTDTLKQVERFPAPLVIKHEDHYLIVYVDSHYQLADTEIAAAFVESMDEQE